MIAPGAVLLGLLLAVMGVVVTTWLVRRLWKGGKEASTRHKVIAIAVAGAAMLGVISMLLGLVKASGAVGGVSIDPSQEARILAEGTSEALNGIAFGVVLWVPSVVAGWVIVRRRKGSSGS